MNVRLKMFAVLKERSGAAEAELQLPQGTKVSAALEQIGRRFPGIADVLPKAAVAVNLNYAGRDTVLHDGNELALIPPVSGGRA
jgi:molybdopterin converting factor subunit 1